MTDEMANGSDDRLDVAVIGAGQAGLAIGYFLAKRRTTLRDLRRRRFNRRRVAQSLELACALHAASLRQPSWPVVPRRAERLSRRETRSSAISSTTRRLSSCRSSSIAPCIRSPLQTGASSSTSELVRVEAKQVVVATGPFQAPNVPSFATDLAPDVAQMHSTGYRGPSDVPEGTVVVVGGGNTGFQIAKELSATHTVHLAIGSRQTPLPQRVLGRDLFWWLTKTGLIKKTVESRIGSRARDRDTLIGSSTRDVKRHGVEVEPRVIHASGRAVKFEDSGELEVDAVDLGDGLPLRVRLDRRSCLRR